jgi:hypothetical protein
MQDSKCGSDNAKVTHCDNPEGLHTHAAVYQAHPFLMETILLSICLEHEKMIEEILPKLKNKGIEKQ